MKTYALTAIACTIAIASSFGKIINGYDRDINTALASLEHLSRLPQTQAVLARIKSIREFIVHHRLTEAMLHQFRSVCPALFEHVDTISDYRGRRVDVYVKFVPSAAVLEGTIANTNLNQQPDDEHGYLSPYGPQTVYVEITLVPHSLRILAHEFGHVSYQVPNLASYVRFFKRNYGNLHSRAEFLGHKPGDPSAQQAELFEQTFRKSYALWMRSDSTHTFDAVLLRKEIEQRVNPRYSSP